MFDAAGFGTCLKAWYDEAARDLPWRRTRDPYAILVSELMLQQTQVQTVIPYFHRFMARYPTPQSLAEAPEEEVLKAWEGLGYYRRARHLHAAARTIGEAHGGVFPESKPEIDALKGVGAYTSAAVASIAFDLPHACVDGNVIRVISRVRAIDADTGEAATRKLIAALADEMLLREAPGDYNQAMMELGATICTPRRPSCLACPVRSFCATVDEGTDPHARPVKRKRARVSELDLSCLFLIHERRFLLCRRSDEGLMAGMWELPAQPRDTMKPWSSLTGGDAVLVSRSEPPVCHRFTHIAARYFPEVYRCESRPVEVEIPETYTDRRWVNPDDLVSVPHTRVLKKIIPRLIDYLEDRPCSEKLSTLPGM